MQRLLQAYAHLFTVDLPKGLPPERTVDHKITLIEGCQPPHHRIYRLYPAEDRELLKQLKKLQAAGMIEETNSPFGAGILFAKKKDGTERLCVDYRALNRLTIHDRYPLPRIDSILDKIGGAQWFTKLDLHSGFHQVRSHPDDVVKTAFNTPHGSWAWKVMPFGLTNAPSTFQRLMDQTLRDPIRQGWAQVFIDDVLIFTAGDEDDHMVHVEKVFKILMASQLYCKLKKCTLCVTEVEFCGYIVAGMVCKSWLTRLTKLPNGRCRAMSNTFVNFWDFVGFIADLWRDLPLCPPHCLHCSVTIQFGTSTTSACRVLCN